MKKIFSIITLLLLALQGAMATVTITAPSKPASLDAEIVAGKGYALYNCSKAMFAGKHTSYNNIAINYNVPEFFQIEKNEDGTFSFTKDSKYIDTGQSDGYLYMYSASLSYRCVNIVLETSGICKIQNAYVSPRNYDENAWWGVKSSSSTYVYYNGTSCTEWILVPEEVCSDSAKTMEVRQYAAKRELYNAGVEADAKGLHVEAYEAIYNDPSQTYNSLMAYVKQLKDSESLTETHSYLFTDWSDYPIMITSVGAWSKDYDNKLRKEYRNAKGATNKLSTSVYVDQPSTFVFSLYSGTRWTNEPVLPFKVYIDGKVAYEYNGETYRYTTDSYFAYVLHGSDSYSEYGPYGRYYGYNSSNIEGRTRHFVNIEPGHHLIDIETTNNYGNNDNSIYHYLSELGIEKTPELSVNLAKVGTLGDEVLRAMDNNPLFPECNIRNVRKLKISGAMGDADWEELYNMNMLFSLDLTDANITEIKKEQLSLYAHSSLGFLHELKLPKTLTTIGQEAFCSSYIRDVDIPESVTSIGDYAFAFTRVKHANIPNVKTLGHNAFWQCNSLEDVTMKNVETIGINAFAECYNIKTVTFEGTPTKVPERMFYWCDEIENISIPETVTNIEQYAFHAARKSKLGKLPDGLKTADQYSFYQNYFATFALPEGLRTVGESAFDYNYRMTGNIPSTLTSVGKWAFRETFTKSENKPDTLYLAPNATYGEQAFYGCGVKNYVIPETYYNLTTSKLFTECDSLESIKVLSPTMLTVASDFVEGLTKRQIKISVPS